MSAEQRPEFVLEVQLAVVFFLPGNVLLDLRQSGLANRKVCIPALPLEIRVVRPLLLELEIPHPL